MPVICRTKLQTSQPIRRHIALAIMALLVAISSGCQTFNGSTDDSPQASNQHHKSKAGFSVGLEKNPSWVNDVDTNQDTDAWQRIRQGFQLQDHLDNPRIDHQRLWFASRGRSIEIISERSNP